MTGFVLCFCGLNSSSSIWVAASSFAISGFVVIEPRGEVRGEIGVHGDNFRDVPIEFLDESHVVHHVAGNSRLVVLVHLLNQHSVTVQH